MVLTGVEGHPPPSLTQDPTAPFASLSGGLDVRRIAGSVLPLPAWDVTDAHRSSAAALTTSAAVQSELREILPVVLALIALIFVLRYLIMSFVVTPLGRALIPPPPAGGKYSVEKTLTLFETAGWEAVWYTCSCCYGFYVYQRESWSCWPTSNFWVDWPLQSFDKQFK